MPCACAAPTSRRFGRRSVYELYLPQLPAISDFFFFPDQVDPCAAGSPARTGPDARAGRGACASRRAYRHRCCQVSWARTLCLAGRTVETPTSGRRRPRRARSGSSGRRACRIRCSRTCRSPWTGTEIDITDKIEHGPFLRFRPVLLRPPVQPGLLGHEPVVRDVLAQPGLRQGSTTFQELYRNAYDWETSGVDVQVDWRFDLGPGQLGVSWLVSWLDSFTTTAEGSVGATDEWTGTIGFDPPARIVGASLPEWKSNLHVSYAWGDLTVGASWRYIDSMTGLGCQPGPRFRGPAGRLFRPECELRLLVRVHWRDCASASGSRT